MRTTMDCMGNAALGVKITNADPEGRYSIEKQIITDPHLSCLLVHTKFNVAPEWQGRLHLYVLCAPHLKIGGWHNNGEVTEARGRKFLMAYRDDVYLAISCVPFPFIKLSCGYVGVNDGWTDLFHNLKMDWEYDSALDGNIALTGEVDLSRGTEFTLGVGFGHTRHNAAAMVAQSLSHSLRDHRQHLSRPMASHRQAPGTAGQDSTPRLLAVCPQRQPPAGTRGQNVSRRHDRQPEYSVGPGQE